MKNVAIFALAIFYTINVLGWSLLMSTLVVGAFMAATPRITAFAEKHL